MIFPPSPFNRIKVQSATRLDNLIQSATKGAVSGIALVIRQLDFSQTNTALHKSKKLEHHLKELGPRSRVPCALRFGCLVIHYKLKPFIRVPCGVYR